MANILLKSHSLPPFSLIRNEDIEPAIRELITQTKDEIERLLNVNTVYTWENLLQPIEQLDDDLANCWSPISHLNGVMNSQDLRTAYNACLPLLSEYNTWLGQHTRLCAAHKDIANAEHFSALECGQQRAVTNALRDFHLAGVSLPDEEKARYGELKMRLSELASKFGENVLDATNAWSKVVSKDDLEGLPASALAAAKQAAENAELDGYLINLEFPSVQPVLSYCDNEALRREVYTANCTRASDQGPHAGQWDNSSIILETLELRAELAQLLGFQNYAELSLAKKMANETQQVTLFLQELNQHSRAQAQRELSELQSFAETHFAIEQLNAWDIPYYAEKLRQHRFNFSQEDIRPYLPITKVLPGLFEVVKRLYGVEIEKCTAFDSYHPDVQLFEINEHGKTIARFYLDLYARADKRGGAWMDDCRVRRRVGEHLQLPVAYMVCNFTPAVGDAPALLTDSELVTLFHEFGHGLHHMLTQQTVAAVSGINGVAWDAVELPSQFLENWCWEEEALAFISGHYLTGEPLPTDLLSKMLAARNFQSAMLMARQLEFSLFDFRLHLENKPDNQSQVQQLMDDIRDEVAVVVPPPFNRFGHSFSHIFAGGYAAGYYSYKWAEVLSADAFSRFEEEGIFNSSTGADFRTNILEAGGSQDAMNLFVAFRGRKPDIEPLLRHCGISTVSL